MSDGWDVLLALVAFAVPGVVVAPRQPGNPIGWILVGLGALGAFYTDAARYAVYDYHFHHGALPFGPAAAVVAQALTTPHSSITPLNCVHQERRPDAGRRPDAPARARGRGG